MTLPPRLISAEDADRLAVRREGAKQLQEMLKERIPTPQALTKAIDGGWSRRRDAVQMLGFLGRDAEAIRLALEERDAQAVIDEALKFLPAPIELVAHAMQMKRGDANSRMLYTFTSANYLHAESAIVGVVAKSPAKLTGPLITALGHAGFRSATKALLKHAQIDAPCTYADALAAGRTKDKPSYAHGPDTSAAARQWDAPTERAFAAVGALRRLDQPIDVAAVTDWHRRIYTAMPTQGSSYPGLADALLSWALFDAGIDAYFEHWLALEYLQRETEFDMMATLLKRGDTQRLARLAPMIATHAEGASRHFCHWPVADWFQSQGQIPSQDSLSEMYCLSRDAGIPPPSWWQWRSEWEPGGFYQQRLRGRL